MSSTPPPPPPPPPGGSGGYPPPPPGGGYGGPPPGYPSSGPAGSPPPNNMALSIIGTVLGLCSCIGLILGIIAIVFASQVNGKWQMGDVAGANQSAQRAKVLAIIAVALGVIGLIFNIISIAVGNSVFYVRTT